MRKTTLRRTDFPYNSMGLTKLFNNPTYECDDQILNCKVIEQVLGEPFGFQKNQKNRPYIYNSVVTSIDGKIAFMDAPEGPLIASKNAYALSGAMVDWWFLNLLRSSADAILFGANTLLSEPTATGHIYDHFLEEARIMAGKNAVPINVIPTLDGLDIPFDHIEFHNNEIPVIFYTVNKALPVLLKHIPNLIVLGPYASPEEVDFLDFVLSPSNKYAMICGNGSLPDPHVALRILHKLGVKRLLVESPMMTHLFLQEHLMDELFINISCLYVGGDAMSIGKKGNSFTSTRHPHSELVKIYMHSPHFIYTRHRVMEQGES